jgi:ATP-dependent DNA ligase
MDLFDQTPDKTSVYLISKDAKGKIRCIHTNYSKNKEGYVIHRTTWQLGGKQTVQPEISITKGKANRTVLEQTQLQFNAIVKEYKDKGYKEVDRNPEEISSEDLEAFVPKFATDARGIRKHMLAKSADHVSKSTIDKLKYWYASRKIDGVRCSMFWNGREIKTSSRGGGHYDYSTAHITKHPVLIEYFKKHPDVVLDGELYKHGKSLQQISGAARLEKNAVDCDWLQYYVYDIMIPDTPFKERLKMLIEFAKEVHIGFNPYHTFKDGALPVQIVPQVKVSGYDNIIDLHNKYVEEGWEGVVIRDPNANYEFGARKNIMIKIKQYQDSEFLVVDYELGLRGVEDMVFICETPNGNRFKAKPMGDKSVKEEYVENFDEKYRGTMATVKYFYYSNGGDIQTGVPLQPCLKAFRPKIDM